MAMSIASLPVLSTALPPLPPPPPAPTATPPPTTTTMTTNYRFRDPTQSRPFLCPFPNCDGRFHRKFTLHEHMKTHTGEQPHQCPIKSCGKRFSTSGNLARHKRLHALHKMECPVAGCTRIFTSHEMLAKHQKVHVGTAVHSCVLPGCGKTFSTAGNLTRHMKTQHGLTSSQHASSRRHHLKSPQHHYQSFQRQMQAARASPAHSYTTEGSSPSSSTPGSPAEDVPVVDYDRMLFAPPPAERHFFDMPPPSFLHAHQPQQVPRHEPVMQQQLQQPSLPALAQLPQQPRHQFPSNASLSDQDLQHLFECLF